MAISQKRSFGDIGEKTAAKYLKNKGYEIIETNYQNKFGRRIGEIDIIAKDKGEIVFVEVKTREMQKYLNTLPEENITYGKLAKLAKIANIYLKSKSLENSDFRFDAISVWLDLDNKLAKIKHIDHL
jgi:putative endonuclease